jgi:hypothetical protein
MRMDAPFRSFGVSFAASCLLLAATGCASTWDEVWSQERDWRYITGVNRPDPLVVLRDSTDGHRRAQALGELREPLQNGGNAEEQAVYLKILDTAAASDPEPICRLTAIRTLGRYRDPRAARSLEDIYQLPSRQPKSESDRALNFTLEINSMIRKEALVALETTQDPDAWKMLVNVARQPGPPVEANLTDRQQTQDEKIVAIRALGKYRQQECVDALVHVMKTERDIALRDRALASLEENTGKKWPAKRDEWLKDDIRPQPGLAAQEDNSLLRLIGFTSK